MAGQSCHAVSCDEALLSDSSRHAIRMTPPDGHQHRSHPDRIRIVKQCDARVQLLRGDVARVCETISDLRRAQALGIRGYRPRQRSCSPAPPPGACLQAQTQKTCLRGALASRAEYLGHRAGLIVTVLLAVATIFAFGPEYVSEKLVLVVVELATSYVAGQYLGRMAAYGSLGGVLEKVGIKFRVHPGHLDGAAGLQPLGEFYFFQALLVSLPAVFLAVVGPDSALARALVRGVA
jgi:hypothetical protein